MRFDDRYATAVRSNKLRSDADKTGDVDILGAAGLAGKRVRTLPDGTTAPGAPLAMALLRLFTGDKRAAREIVEITAGMLVGKAHRLGAALDRPEVGAVDAHVVGEGFLTEVPLQAIAAQITPHDPLQLAFHKASYVSVPLLVGLQTYK